MSDSKNYQDLANEINTAWISIYGGEPVSDIFALKMRIKNIAEDRNCWAFNARVLQKAYNELEAKTSVATWTNMRYNVGSLDKD